MYQKKLKETQCVLKNVVVVFPRLFVPENDKYEAMVLIPKSGGAGEDNIKKLQAIIDAAVKEAQYTVFQGVVPKKLQSPLKDGDTAENDLGELKKNKMTFLADKMFCSVHTKRQPRVFNADCTPATESDIYGGCVVNMSVTAGAYKSPDGTKRGISLFLNNVMKVADGTRIGGTYLDGDELLDESLSEKLLNM